MSDLMPPVSAWQVGRLGDLFEIKDRERIPINADERARRTGHVPYFGATGQVGWIDNYLFDQELILLGEDGAPFLRSDKPKAYVIRGEAWVNNHAHVLRALAATPSEFWKYQLDQADYRGFVSGTTRLKLSQQPMRNIPLLVPPLEEQRRIVEALESYFTRLDDAVATLERVQRNLKRYRASVLQAAVEARLVPTEAELARAEGRDYEHASVLLERILAERRRRWEEAEVAKMQAKGKVPKDDKWKAKYKEPIKPVAPTSPEIPEGWCWVSVDQLSHDVRYGTSAKANSQLSTGVPVLRMGNIREGALDFTDLKYMPGNSREFPDLLLEHGDILFNRTNSAELVGKTAVFRGYSGPCSFASYLIRTRCLSGIQPDFIAQYINSSAGRRWIGSVVSQQVGQANVNGSKLKACVIPLPPVAEQSRIVAESERLISLVSQLDNDMRVEEMRCSRLRQSILKWAFEGKLVDQDPTDEPASELLERIRAERAAAGNGTRTNGRRPQPGIRRAPRRQSPT